MKECSGCRETPRYPLFFCSPRRGGSPAAPRGSKVRCMRTFILVEVNFNHILHFANAHVIMGKIPT